MTEVGTAYVTLVPSAKGFASKMQRELGSDIGRLGSQSGDDYSRGFANNASSGIRRGSGKLFSGLAKGALVAGAAAAVAVGKVLVDSVGEAQEAAVIGARTENVIKKMGASAWTSADQIGDLAESLSLKAGVDDEAIQAGANLLLTFGNIRDEAGAGNDIFTQTTGLMLDMSRAMGTDAKGSAIQLGKALNDPIKGISALSRVGVSFTEDQKELITSLVESGNTLDAQKVILGEVEKQFGGAAEAMATPAEKAKVAWGNFEEQLGTMLLPVLNELATGATAALGTIADHGPEIQAVFENIIDGAGELWDAIQPATNEIREAFGHLIGEGGGVGDVFHDDILPAVEGTAKAIGALVDFVDNLPGPVKSMGGEVALAAVAFSALSGGIGKVTARMPGLIGATATAETRMAALKTGIAGVAGAGGMLLLAQGAQESDNKLGLLESAAGGALLGFSLAGPWGAAVGAGAGALLNLATQTGDTATAMDDANPEIQSMKDSLDQLTGATTAATRASALHNLELADGEGQYKSVLGYAQELGISQRTLTDAALGHRGAIKLVNQAIDKQAHGWHDLYDNTGAVVGSYKGIDRNARYLRRTLGIVNDQIRDDKEQMRDAAQVTQDWSGKLKNFPDRARTKIELEGVRPTKTAIAQMTLDFKNLDKQDIKNIIAVTGVDTTVREVRKVAGELTAVDKNNPRPTVDANTTPAEIAMDNFLRNFHAIDGAHSDTFIYTHHVDLGGGGGNTGGIGGGVQGRFIGGGPSALPLAPDWHDVSPRLGGGNRQPVFIVLPDGTQFDAYVDERIEAKVDLTDEQHRAMARN